MSISSNSKRLELCNFKLNTLLNVTRAINENQSVDDLLERYRSILENDLNIGKIIIFKHIPDEWAVVLSAGVQASEYEGLDVKKDLLQYEDISFVLDSPNPVLKAFDIIMPVFNNNKPLAYILIGDIDEEREGISPTIKHLYFIQTLSNLIIVAIEKIRLFNKSIQQEALKKELELASKLQNMLIPENSTLPNNKYIHFKAYYNPHFEIGGDYYDVIELNEIEIGFCIADVSGKGVAAALVMSNFQANLRALFSTDIPLQDLAGILNSRLMMSAKGEKYITIFIAKYNFKTRILEYINAGHNPPIFYEIADKKATYLSKGCVGLGMLDEIPIVKKGQITINQPSKLLCFTDGIVETLKGDGVDVSTKALEVNISNDLSIENNIEDIIIKNNLVKDNSDIFDDITMLGIDFNI